MLINPDDPDWEKTAAGRPYSYKYGYGRLDAFQYVTAAKTWDLVKPQAWLEMPLSELGDGKVDSNGAMLGGQPIVSGGVGSTLTVSHDLLMEHNFEKLEHVTVTVWINHTIRGDVEVELLSPNGVRSVLAGRRQHDNDPTGYPGWTFMSIKHWLVCLVYIMLPYECINRNRDENPIGNWTLNVSDQNTQDRSGRLLGWTMTLFGSSIDASAAVPYALSSTSASPGNPLPPASPTAAQGGTKSYPKPTSHLPGDHGAAPGEANKPSFGQSEDAEASTPSVSTTPDEGYFQGMSHLLSNSTWLIGAFGAVILFSIGCGIFFWRRRIGQYKNRPQYDIVAEGEDLPMMDQGNRAGGRGGRDGGRTRELYDAFGEDYDADEDDETTLRGPVETGGLEFHQGFLEDDDPTSTPYKDEPGGREQPTIRESTIRSGSPGSGDDGSWEHASQQARVE